MRQFISHSQAAIGQLVYKRIILAVTIALLKKLVVD